MRDVLCALRLTELDISKTDQLTFCEVEKEIEALSDEIGLLDWNEVPITGRMAVIEIAKRFPDESDKLWKDILEKKISIEDYRNGWIDLIRRMNLVSYFCDFRKSIAF